MRETRNITKLECGGHLKDIPVDRRIISKYILKKSVRRMSTGREIP
jgi:hypothetical protein